MLSVAQAENLILKSVKTFPAVRVSLSESFGRILRENIFADRDLPPFDRVAMDGIAVDFASWQKGRREFAVENVQKAGAPVLKLRDPKNCIEVMTGAVLPLGCSCVVPVENVEFKDGKAVLRESFKIPRMLNVHGRGSDYKKGSLLLKEGSRLSSPQIAVAASVGKSGILVAEAPRIAVVATGDELVGVERPVRPFQIRQSNAYALHAALALYGGCRVRRFHLRDDKKVMSRRLKQILKEFDVLLLSGGVSRGKFDYVPEVLDALGVKVLFHKVKQRPGKPFWFGQTQEGKPVFALPGNPVATQVCLYRYVIPYLNKAAGSAAQNVSVLLDRDVPSKTALTHFLPVKVRWQEGCLIAAPVPISGSGDYASLAQSDGFVELGADTERFAKGNVVRFYGWGLDAVSIS